MKKLPSNSFVVILSGGSGTRFWPKSRQKKPKQLCCIGPMEKTLLEQTIDRVTPLVPADRIIIVTHVDQKELTESFCKGRVGHVVAEPKAMNTAAALTLAALYAKANLHLDDPDQAVMISLHADHYIKDSDAFARDLHKAFKIAQKDVIGLIGIPPSRPETGFGYIECGHVQEDQSFQVKSFKEKPDLQTAQEYLKQKKYLWNSGYFFWKIGVLCAELEQFLPKTLEILNKVFLNRKPEEPPQAYFDRLVTAYSQVDEISIDHAVLEKSKRLVVIAASFDWQDLGSWNALEHCFAGDDSKNLVAGNIYIADAKNVTIDSDAKIVACIGVSDVAIVVHKGCVLVVNKKDSQKVKDVVAYLKESGQADLT